MEKKKGSGMPEFERDHWERKVDDLNLGQHRYSSEMNQCEEYKTSVDKLAAYARKHKAEH